MDTVTAVKKLIIENITDKYTEQIESLLTMAQTNLVTDHTTCKKAIDLYIQAKKIESLIETTRKLIKSPYLEVINFIDTSAQKTTKELTKIQEALQEQIDSFCLNNDENIISALGTATIKNKTTWVIHSHTELPPEVISARHEQIRRAIAPKIHDMLKAGATKIPGIMVSEDEIVQITTNRKAMEG